MRQISGRETHADVVNRRSRIALVAVLFLTAVFAAAIDTSPDPESGPVGSSSAFEFVAAGVSADLPVSNAGAIREVEPSPSESLSFDLGAVAPLDPIVALADDSSGGDDEAVLEEVVAATTNPAPATTAPPTAAAPPPPTTTEPPPTTAPPPPTTTEPPPTTTLPPPTTTEPPPTTVPPPTTTLPPPTTTEPPPSDLAFYAVLSADVSCDDDEAEITWKIANPKEDWNKGWTMVIDGDNRGVFSSGTKVTRGKAEAADEEVDSGSFTLSVTVHWAHGGEPDAGHGTYSTSVSAECDDD